MRLALAAALGLIPGATLADEVWITGEGPATYLSDHEHIGVIEVPLFGEPVRLYVMGLGGNVTERFTMRGYWIASGEGFCGVTMTGPDGWSSTRWGMAIVSFDRYEYPTGWTASLGDCWGDSDFSIRADLPE